MLKMITQGLTVTWLLFQTFHAFPVNEILDKGVPISNNETTQEKNSSLASLAAKGEQAKAGSEEQTKAGPAQFDSKSIDEKFLKKLEDCKKVAEKQEDYSWSIKKECLTTLLAEANKKKKELKNLKASKVVRKDLVTFTIEILQMTLELIKRIYLGIRNTILATLFPRLYYRYHPYGYGK